MPPVSCTGQSDQLAAFAQQPLAAVATDPPPIGIHRIALGVLVLPTSHSCRDRAR